MDSIFGVVSVLSDKEIAKFDLKNTLEMCGYQSSLCDSNISDDGYINFSSELGIKEVYNLYRSTCFRSAMYLYHAGAACQVVLDDTSEQIRLLKICNNFITELQKIYTHSLNSRSDKDNYMIQYAMYYAMYIKVWLVEYIPDLSCDVCRMYSAKSQTYETILEGIRQTLENIPNYSLYRISAKIMAEFEEVDKSLQLFNLLYSWYNVPNDLIDMSFLNAANNSFRNIDISRLQDVEVCESYLIRAYNISESDGDDTVEIKYLVNALDMLERDCSYCFQDMVNTISIITELTCIMSRKEDKDLYDKYYNLRQSKIEEMQNENSSKFIALARYCNFSADEFIDMLGYFIDVVFDQQEEEDYNEQN